MRKNGARRFNSGNPGCERSSALADVENGQFCLDDFASK
jgi:hypothetical protein